MRVRPGCSQQRSGVGIALSLDVLRNDTLCKMRVLMFGWEYPPYAAGGLATATMALANGLVRIGHAVTLVVPFLAAAGTGGVRVVSASNVSPNLRMLRSLQVCRHPHTDFSCRSAEFLWRRRNGNSGLVRRGTISEGSLKEYQGIPPMRCRPLPD